MAVRKIVANGPSSELDLRLSDFLVLMVSTCPPGEMDVKVAQGAQPV